MAEIIVRGFEVWHPHCVTLSYSQVMYSICSQNTTILDWRGTYISTTCFGQYIGHLQVVLNL